jgi:hypothetical protein
MVELRARQRIVSGRRTNGARFSEAGSWGASMALERGRIIGYDNRRMTFEFTMTDAIGQLVDCKISSAAMDQLAGGRGTTPSEREAQFLDLRDEIERIATDLFDEALPKPVRMVRIFYHHIRLGTNEVPREQDHARVAGGDEGPDPDG